MTDVEKLKRILDISLYNWNHKNKKCNKCESLNTEQYTPLKNKLIKIPHKKKHVCSCDIVIGKPHYFTTYYKCKDCGNKFTC